MAEGAEEERNVTHSKFGGALRIGPTSVVRKRNDDSLMGWPGGPWAHIMRVGNSWQFRCCVNGEMWLHYAHAVLDARSHMQEHIND